MKAVDYVCAVKLASTVHTKQSKMRTSKCELGRGGSTKVVKTFLEIYYQKKKNSKRKKKKVLWVEKENNYHVFRTFKSSNMVL